MFKILKYKTEKEECPIDLFIVDLIKNGRKDEVDKIYFYIKLLENNGDKILINQNWAKKISESIFELRPKSNRILYFSLSDDSYILLHGFKKKTQKTPKSEIEKAEKEMNDFKRRCIL